MERKKYYNYGVPSPDLYEQVTVGLTPVRLNPTPSTTHMLLLVQYEPVRWRADDSPSSTVGIRLLPGDYLDWVTSDVDWTEVIKRMQFVKDADASGRDAELQIQYFR